MRVFASINPYDLKTIAEHEAFNDSQVAAVLGNAAIAFDSWQKTSIKERCDLLFSISKILEERNEQCAKIITNEMGKTFREAKAEVKKCAAACHYYAEKGEQLLQDEFIPSQAKKSFVTFQPIGAVLAIMPWNFPFWQVIRAAVPALLAGNVVLLKHAPNVFSCSKEIEKLFLEAGFPAGAFQSLIIDVDQIERIVSNDIVQGVTLTGSELAGASVSSLAGKHIKKTILELGGSDPLIVLEDADLNKAAAIALESRMQNAGQSCIASKRIIVTRKTQDELMHLLLEKIEKYKQGNPMDESVSVGPMARADLAEKLELQQNRSVEKGAAISFGGNRNSCNYQPTLLLNVRPGMPAFDEETFGPVTAIITAGSESEAIQLANQSRYGLGASVFTSDLEKGERIAKQLNAGSVFINTIVKSDVRFPFGGVKKSGYGRELSYYGLKEFTNIKSVIIHE